MLKECPFVSQANLRRKGTKSLWSGESEKIGSWVFCGYTTGGTRRWCFKTLLLQTQPFNLLTYSMEQSPSWEASSSSATQEISLLFYGTRRFITAFTTAPPPVPLLRQIDPVHAPTFHFSKIHFNIIFPSMPGSSEWSPSLEFAPFLSPYVLHVLPISVFLNWSPE